MLDHGGGDLDGFGGVPYAEIALGAADLGTVAGAGGVALGDGAAGFALDGGVGLEAVAAVAGVAVLEAREPVVVERAVGLAGLSVHGCGVLG